MVTLKDIAREAGVSALTVSNVLNGKLRECWPSTIERANRIRDIARKHGYRPSATAKAMRSGRHNAVAILADFHENGISPNVVSGMCHELSVRHWRPVVGHVSTEDADSGRLPGFLDELCVDGMLVTHPPARLRERVRALVLPAVWTDIHADYDAVYPDERGAARTLTAEMIQLGHRRIAYVELRHGAVDPDFHAEDRRAGYLAAMDEAGLPPRVVSIDEPFHHMNGSPADPRVGAMTALLSGEAPPTAVVVFEAYGVGPLVVAAERTGRRVGVDLCVATFFRGLVSMYGVPVTARRTPLRAVGVEAVRMLREKMDHPGVSIPSRAVPYGIPGDAREEIPLIPPPAT